MLHLPIIVEAAESSPQAAAAAAYQIRKILSKDFTRPHVQYNAIMLIRILSDNPGPTFTRNMDAKFTTTVKDLLRQSKSQSVQQTMRQTLDTLEAEKSHDEGLTPLITMWRDEKGRGSRIAPPVGRPPNFHVPPYNPNNPPLAPSQQEPNQRVFGKNRLPPLDELATRIEEAKNTAKILLQLVQSTPTEDITANDLIKEFAERCQTAQRSMQEYINCDSPPPEDDTLQTLIEVNEQLSLALSRHQRAVLAARRSAGTATPSPNPSQNSAYPPPPPQQQQTQYAEPVNLLAPVIPARPTAEPSTSSFPDFETFEAPPGPPPSKVAAYPSAEPQYQSYNPFADPATPSSSFAQPQTQTYHGDLGPSQSTASPPRPSLGDAYYQGVTPSYMGRQASAADGLTMHGGGDSGTDATFHGQGSGSGQYPAADSKPPVTYRY